MDLVPYQLDPAVQALEQPRQRILIADAVGLGKTLEAGILVSELIKRGKYKDLVPGNFFIAKKIEKYIYLIYNIYLKAINLVDLADSVPAKFLIGMMLLKVLISAGGTAVFEGGGGSV
jgi:SNF2 family DNA or RNA helicase